MKKFRPFTARSLGAAIALTALIGSLLVVPAPADAWASSYSCEYGNRYFNFSFQNDHLAFSSSNSNHAGSSLNQVGMLEYPWVKDGETWYQIQSQRTGPTDRGLRAAFGVGDSGVAWPETLVRDLSATNIVGNPLNGLSEASVDPSGFIETSTTGSRCVGYGVLKTTARWSLGAGTGALLINGEQVKITVENTFELAQNSRFLSVTTRVINNQGSPDLPNVQMWAGDNDLRVSNDLDGVESRRGNVADSSFTKIEQKGDASNAVLLTKRNIRNGPAGLGALAFTPHPGARSVIALGTRFYDTHSSSVVTTNPVGADIERLGTNKSESYGLFFPLGDLPRNSSAEFIWFLAGVHDQTIGAISDEMIAASPPPPAQAPTAPTITTITPGDGQLTVAFTAPVSDGGDPITEYQYLIDGVFESDFVATSSPFVVSGLTNGTTYTVTLKAKNDVGSSPPSTGVTGTPVAPEADPAPTSAPAPKPGSTPTVEPSVSPTPTATPPAPTPPASEPETAVLAVPPSGSPPPSNPPAAPSSPPAATPAGPGVATLTSEELMSGSIALNRGTQAVIMPAVLLHDIAVGLLPPGAPLDEGALKIETGQTLLVAMVVSLGDVTLTASELGGFIQFTLIVPGFESNSMTVTVAKQTLAALFWVQVGLIAAAVAVGLGLLWWFLGRRNRKQVRVASAPRPAFA